MTGSRRAVFALLASLPLVLLAAPATAQDTGWVIDRFDTTIRVRPDAAVEVTEVIAVDFQGLERHGIFRVIPARYRLSTDEERAQVPAGLDPQDFLRAIDISGIRVTSTAPADTEITRPNRLGEANVRIRIGDPDVTVTGRQEYRISYEVRGALNRFDDVAELAWNATGDDWPVPIRRAHAVVEGPEILRASCSRGPQGSSQSCEETPVAPAGGSVTFATGELAPEEGMTVTVGFAAGAVDVPPPMLIEQWDLGRSLTGSPAAVPLAALTSLLGFGAVGLLAYRQGRDQGTRGGLTVDGRPDQDAPARRSLIGPRPTPVRYRPPEDLRPAQLGVVVDERVDPVDVSATIVDLAVRGYLTIEETRKGLLGRKRDWTLKRTDKVDAGLLDYERTLLGALFKEGHRVELSDLKGSFASDYEKVSKRLYTDAVARGWFPRSPEHTRTLWLGLGIVALVVTGGLAVLASLYTTAALAVVPLVAAALVLTLAHRWMPHRTPEGSRLLAETLGFREFIRTAEAGRMEFAEQENLFVTYLPYAVVFGAVERWAAAFRHLGTAAATGVGTWYVSPGGYHDFGALAGGLASFSHSVGSDLSYSPSSSSGGGSGGGFGGGGGGSW
ncbi:MAG TPA: DUF2207 domain-containing protein [Egibacteraceae bacterium]|jgi:uncharacterized protein (TIGR04222 family)|nr:DUF2207 domain-containing protein [Egibacteraceae bacterium]